MEKEKKKHQGAKTEEFHPKVEAAKIGCFSLGFRMVRFFQKKSNLIRDRYLVCFEKIFSYPYKRATFCYL
jgi:hypothetical protein